MVNGFGFNGITEMQQMTSSVCSSASAGLEGRLKDTRDEKVYWVGKLPDGNCWMTQNLDLDLYANGAGRELTSADSDVTNDWISTTGASALWTTSSSNYNIVKYYDPGNYYYSTPSIKDECSSNKVGLSACTGNGWTKFTENSLEGWTATHDENFISATEYVGSDGWSICSKEAGSLLGNSVHPQCSIYYYGYEHYLAGSHYTYQAATAENAPSDSGTAEGSICPKGWRLPTNSQYITLANGLAMEQVIVRPYYFVYSGWIDSNEGTLRSAGNAGIYWSATTSDRSLAFSFVFNTRIIPSSNDVRSFGYSVRCVAK